MNQTDIFKEFIEHIFGKIPQKDWELLKEISKVTEVKKGHEILSFGETCRYLWFLVKGAVRAFELSQGVEKSNYFLLDKSLFIDYYSITTGTGSELCFKAEEDCQLIEINYNELLRTYDDSPVLERIGRIMAERQFVIEFELRRLFLTKDALQRYNYLMESNAEVFNRFSLKHIASFIGVTPVSLSRLRKMKL